MQICNVFLWNILNSSKPPKTPIGVKRAERDTLRKGPRVFVSVFISRKNTGFVLKLRAKKISVFGIYVHESERSFLTSTLEKQNCHTNSRALSFNNSENSFFCININGSPNFESSIYG